MNSFTKRHLNDNEGFTLVEVLVTMAVLGIIAGVVIPMVFLFMGAGDEEAFLTEHQNMQTAITATMALMRANEVKGDFVDDGKWHQDFSDPNSVYVEGEDGSRLTFRDVIAPGHLKTAYWYQITSDGKILGSITSPE